MRLYATVLTVGGQVIAQPSVTWSSTNSAVAAVDASGLVTSKENGAAGVTAQSGAALASVPVTVRQVPDSVVLSPASLELQSLRESAQLSATVLDRNGHVIVGVPVSWHSTDPTVATVVAGGLVVARSNGATTITATADAALAEILVTVAQVATTVEIIPPKRALIVGHALQLLADVADARGTRIDSVTVTWSSADESVATVDMHGWVRGEREGTTEITATVDTVSASLTLDVIGDRERDALVSLWESTNGSKWLESDNWMTDKPLSEWYGITANSAGRVTELNLYNNGLSGPLPAEIGDLVNLTYLHLNQNSLVREVPHEIGQLVELERLLLGGNSLAGRIPESIGNLVRMENLQLGGNRLVGGIPATLGHLSHLKTLELGGNQLTGFLPPSLTRLNNLERITWDRLSVCLPGTFTFRNWLDDVKPTYYELALSDFCDARDRIALTSLHNATNGANWIELDGWLTGGPLDLWHGIKTDSLGMVSQIELSNNNLTGDLPATVGQFEMLVGLWIDGNPLDGRLPASLASLPLRDLHFDDTGICVPTETSFRDWMSRIQLVTSTGRDCAPLTDWDALRALFQSTRGTQWKRGDNWLSDLPLDMWYGVTTDPDGAVTKLTLSNNNLTGRIPDEIGSLQNLEVLTLDGNGLTGAIPRSIGRLRDLVTLTISGNSLTGEIPEEIGNLAKLEVLRLHVNQLRGSIPSTISGLERLRILSLGYNDLAGRIPDEIGHLRSLDSVYVHNNNLVGPLPSTVGNLVMLRVLSASHNEIDGKIPGAIGSLTTLDALYLNNNRLTGDIPREIGRLEKLTTLRLGFNRLNGEMPREFGELKELRYLYVHGNDLGGSLPAEIGRMRELRSLILHGNRFEGKLPSEIGQLSLLRELDFRRNMLSGSVPPEYAGMTSLRLLRGSGNPEMAGVLPSGLTGLDSLGLLMLSDTHLCAPNDAEFGQWLEGLRHHYVAHCREQAGTPFYMIQAIQSFDHPVPLVAGDPALLRVFVTSDRAGSTQIPPVRATFFHEGVAVHTVDVPAGPSVVPQKVDEGLLDGSANADVPGWVVQPGVEVVIEIDPDGTTDRSLGLKERIPGSGRVELDVQSVPNLALTVVPFLWESDPDYSVVERAEALGAQHGLMGATRTLLPVGSLELKTHERVWTSVDPTFSNVYSVLSQTRAIQVAEGSNRYYMGILRDGGGAAYVSGLASVAGLRGNTIAHELGHNMSLLHAPCGGPRAVDPGYPHEYGTIGVWGYDPRLGKEMPPTAYDLMSYCADWISDYSFKRALRHRSRGLGATPAPATMTLLLWGGVNEAGNLVLEPSFVIDATPSLPASSGPYRLTGHNLAGDVLFSLGFNMGEVVDGRDDAKGFAFTLPVEMEWADVLAEVVLTGPEGSVAIDREGDTAMAFVRNEATGAVRGFLHDWPTALADAGLGLLDPGLRFQVSRGVPDKEAWRR